MKKQNKEKTIKELYLAKSPVKAKSKIEKIAAKPTSYFKKTKFI